jgi:hypothetical protein
LNAAGMQVREVSCRAIEARTDQWLAFLAAYHEGVLGWVGGVEKLDGRAADAAAVDDRLELMGDALRDVLGPSGRFDASWTYITAAPSL